MIAWEWLLLKSLAPDESTAWVHLQNQAGTVISDGYIVEPEMQITASVVPQVVTVSLAEPVQVAVTQQLIQVEVSGL